jgi:RimJ/RimL family protein N-acetyltransferase
MSQASRKLPSAGGVTLRDVEENDLAIFFEFQKEPEANQMAAFTALDPTDREAFLNKWRSKILGDASVIKKTILFEGRVAGNVMSYALSGKREVCYWIGKEFWGKGIATSALTQFLDSLQERPLHARAAKDNVASLRVLEKCGFARTGVDRGFANGRGVEIDEVVLLFNKPNSQLKARLTLRRLEQDDAEGVHSLWSDKAAVFFTNFPYIQDLDGCRARLARVLEHYAPNPLHFGPYTILSEQGAFLGLVGGDAIDPTHQAYDLWYFIQRKYWGQKVATTAVRILLQMMADSNRVRTVRAEAVVENEPSWKFLQSLGFKRTELLTGAHQKDGQSWDRYVYSKTIKEI